MVGKRRRAERRSDRDGTEPAPGLDTGQQRRARTEKRLGLLWLLSLVIGPVFGWGLSNTYWLVTDTNWKSWMVIRIVLALIWPLVSLSALIVFANKAGGSLGSWRNGGKQYLLVTVLLGFPAVNAARDLWGGVETSVLKVVDKETTAKRRKAHRFLACSIELSNGRSYPVDCGLPFRDIGIGDPCQIHLLPHTDILLALQPVAEPPMDRPLSP